MSSSERGLGARLVTNTLHSAGGRIAGLVVWILFTPAIVRALGTDGFALWSLFYALTGHLTALDFGLAQGTLRHVAAARGQGDHEGAGAFATLGVLGYLGLGLAWIGLALVLQGPALVWLRVPDVWVPSARFALLAGAGVFALSGVATITMAVSQGYDRFDLANRVLIVVALFHSAGFALALQQGWGLRGLVTTVGLGWLTGCGIGLGMLRRAVPEFHFRPPGAALSRAREALRFGGPMQVTNLLAVFNMHVDKLLIARIVGLSTVTSYELGSRVAFAASSVPQLLLLAVLPEAAALHAGEDVARLRDLYLRGSRYVLTATAVVLAALLASSDRLYAVWLGPGHAEAALAMRWISLAAVTSLAMGMGTTIARGIGRTEMEAWFAVLAVAVHLGLSLWLIPLLGLRGALIGTLGGNLAGAALFTVLLGAALDWPRFGVLLSPLGVPLLASAIGTAAGWGLDHLIPGGPGAGGWLALGLVSAGAGLAALLVTIGTGYFHWREARTLLATAGPWRRQT